jgi:pimeloyl-ACP methyl ester carboxylesterase
MDHYADDLAELVAHLDLQNAVHVGHSTGGAKSHTTWADTGKAAWRKLRSSAQYRR